MSLLIIALILLGVLLLIAELILLPGLSIAGFFALISYAGASYLAFTSYNNTVGVIVIVTIVILSVIAAVISMKSKTWNKFALKDELKGSSQPMPEEEGLKIGDLGLSITRLAPMGTVKFGDKVYEAKSFIGFIDQSCDVEVVGFDNSNVIVKKTK